MSINDVQEQVVKDFSSITDRLDKFEHLIQLGKKLEPLDESFKTDEFAIQGCTSKVWIVGELKEGKVFFKGESDTAITKGILSLLIKVLNNQKPQDIVEADLFFSEKIGLKQNLSPTRVIGLGSMIKQMRLIAKKFT